MTHDRNGQKPPADEWLSVSDCARRLGVSERTIQRRVKHLPPSDISRRPGQPQQIRFLALVESVPDVPSPKSEPASPADPTPTDSALLSRLLDENAYLRQQNNMLVAAVVRLSIEGKKEEAKETAEEVKRPEKGAQRHWWQFWKGEG